MKTTATTRKNSVFGKDGDGRYVFRVPGHGSVCLDLDKCSAELRQAFLDYGVGALMQDRVGLLKGVARLDGFRKLIQQAESGAYNITLRETAEERAAREARQRYIDLVECFARFDGRSEAQVKAAVEKLCDRQDWDVEDTAVQTLLDSKQLRALYIAVQTERAGERAKGQLNVDDLFEDLSA